MSILTKVLAILLSVFSLLLVGMVVTFVGNSNNYKELYEEQKTLKIDAQSNLTIKDGLYNEQVKKIEQMQKDHLQRAQILEADKNLLASDLRKAQREALKYQADADRWKGLMAGFEQSVRNLQASLNDTQKQLDHARAEGIKSQKELNQITSDLYEKIVQLQSLESERRRLLEQKTELEKLAAKGGTAPKEVISVTPQANQTASRATPATVGTDIKGMVVNVDKNLVTLSVGSADGVTKNMVFHITRGERFLCDVVITNVDINRCAGVLDLMVQPPQVNDTASTEL